METVNIDITGLLLSWRAGDRNALERVIPLLYDELRRRAAARVAHEKPDFRPTPSSLVSEAYLQLARNDVRWLGREHFYAVGSRIMRRLLINRARDRERLKRGGGAEHIGIAEHCAITEEDFDAQLDIDRALERFAMKYPRQARIMEMSYFGGLTRAEIAEALGVPDSSVAKDCKFAIAWLSADMTRVNRDGATGS